MAMEKSKHLLRTNIYSKVNERMASVFSVSNHPLEMDKQ